MRSDPFDALETYGADAIRWYFYVNSAPWLPNRFHGNSRVTERTDENSWELCGTLMRSLFSMRILMILTRAKYTLEYDKLSVMDKWLLSKLNTMVQRSGQ